MTAGRLQSVCVWMAVLVACAAVSSIPAQDVHVDAGRRGGRALRRELFFRESLTAINDWETILAAMADKDAFSGQPPLWPIALDGGQTCWMNPVPLTLRFGERAILETRLRLAGGKVHVSRFFKDGNAERDVTAPGELVTGFQHVGGGGKDRWYHAYHRRFDQLTRLRPVAAPFDVRLDRTPDPGRGTHGLAITVRNAVNRPLACELNLHLYRVGEDGPVGSQTLTVGPRVTETVRFPVPLTVPGGGVLVLSVKGGDVSFRLPLFTHVEDVGAGLRSVEHVLADCPDEAGARELSGLRTRAEAWAPGGTDWRELFLDVGRLRDRLLLGRLDFEAMLFVERMPFDSEQPFMDAHHLRNRPGGGIYRLQPVGPGGSVTAVVDSLGEGIYRDLCLHWNARKLLFAFGNGSDKWDGSQSYHIYQVGVDGRGLRQLTHGPRNDCEPFYLPDGRIGFTSDRSGHFVMCGGNRHAPNLHVMDADGANLRQLSHNVFNEFSPTVLADGRILYSRWEYNERSVTSLHNPFTMNPDGTMVAPCYGNATIRPNVVMFPRPVPGSHKLMALFTAHHGQTHGAIGLIDVRKGMDGVEPITLLTPGVPVTGEKAEDSRHGWFSDPVPLSESTYLCAFTPTVVPWHPNTWSLYVGDRHGSLGLVWQSSELSAVEPVPIVARPAPHLRPSVGHTNDNTATVVLIDAGIGLVGADAGVSAFLRVLEDVPRKNVRHGGVITTSGTPVYTIKRIIGTVPVEADGSACFTVPANRNLYFQLLDGDRREIQRMRSVVCLQPGERQTCVGCHESRRTAPPAVRISAPQRRPSLPVPPPWGDRPISFLRDPAKKALQAVFERRCVACHGRSDGRMATWWLSVNRRDVAQTGAPGRQWRVPERCALGVGRVRLDSQRRWLAAS